MYRTEENSRASAQSGVDIEHDEGGNAFSGATLKISGPDSISTDQDTQQGIPGATSSVLTGSDSGMAGKMTNPTSPAQLPVSTEEPQQVVLVRPKVGSPKNFFSFREGLFEHAVSDCVNILLRPANDTDIIGTWLLTEINHWDHERERVYILTTRTLVEVKYDFISLRILQNTKIHLNNVDTVRRGKVSYPEGSLIPDRSDRGLRIMWNRGQPVGWMTSWNPFAKDIPWRTITDHPLFNYQDPYNSANINEGLDKYRKYYSVEGLHEALVQTIANNNARNSNPNLPPCKFENGPIVLENYIGVAAMIHNKHNFGFFKVRGKFSF